MKNIYFCLLLFFSLSCHTKSAAHDQSAIKDLQNKISHIYQPGFGDIMSIIQIHHAKLWFAAVQHNWALANFEIGEIKEGIEDIEQYKKEEHGDYVAAMKMIDEPIDKVAKAIEQKNDSAFHKNYILLTNTCNTCHQATGHAFIQIKVPDYSPAINQEFSPMPKQ
ncbi:MAG: hypothetical protein R2796_05825 [Chitinophagaceae bacterium]